MRSRARRFAVFMATVGSFAGVAAFVSYSVKARLVMREARGILRADSARAIHLSDAQTKEVRDTLAIINGLANAPCSEQDMESLDKLVFLSHYLKDAGRMQGDRFLCSSALPKSVLPQNQVSPATIAHDGLRTYRFMAQWQIYGSQTILFRMGTAYVDVYLDSHGELSHRSLPDEEYAVALRPEKFQYVSPEIRSIYPPRPPLYITPGDHTEGDRLLATTCSSVLAYCATESIRVSDLLRHNRRRLAQYAGLGGVIGALVGWVIFLRFGRDTTVAGRLKRAIRKGEIRTAFQPIVDLADSRIIGAEVLARWIDDDGVAVSPDIFIRLAEEHGLMDMLTKRIVQRALHDARALLKRQPGFKLSLNVTDIDLRGISFAPMLEKELALAGVSAKQIAIEITENTPLCGDAIAALHVLRKKGHEIHIDDFGAGYSSLPYLTELPVDAVKIDKSYTQAVNTTDLKAGILPQILSMAASLNLEIIAEGIETEDQARYFARSGKRILGQGWLYGKPAYWPEFERRLKQAELQIAAVAKESITA